MARKHHLVKSITDQGWYHQFETMLQYKLKWSEASYAGLTPRQNQSGNRDIRGHITKHGPSMLRFILVNAGHSVIKHSTKMREKYSRLVRRLGRNRAIVAIARILLETIYVMLRKDEDFIDQNGGLTERKIQIMQSRAKGPSQEKDLDDVMKEGHCQNLVDFFMIHDAKPKT